MEVLDGKHHRSPLTQGGLEIKTKVTVVWPMEDKEKFLLLRNYVEMNYDFDKSNEDQSPAILDKIKGTIMGEVHQDDADEIEVEEAQINDEDNVILMESD